MLATETANCFVDVYLGLRHVAALHTLPSLILVVLALLEYIAAQRVVLKLTIVAFLLAITSS